jgi:hypothetical protein
MNDANSPSLQTQKIWDAAPHCAFTDLIFHAGQWLCCFRESDSHALGQLGCIRVLKSPDGTNWTSAHLFSDPAFDLRDPHFSFPGNGRLMLNFSGRQQADGQYLAMESFATFSDDGITWCPPITMAVEGFWVWQVRWHEGLAYTWARKIVEGLPYALFRSSDGIHWDPVVRLASGNETALAVLDDGRILALRRKVDAMLGISSPPYQTWKWQPIGRFAGGPSLLILADGRIIAGCRYQDPALPEDQNSYFALSLVDAERLTIHPIITFPGGQDCGYPGMVEKDSTLWVSHYSGTKSKAAIYLTKIPINSLLA